MERRRRGGGGAGAGGDMVKYGLLLVVLALGGRGVTGLDADGELLMAFRRAVTADPLGALRSWSYSDDSACAWNGVICNGFPQQQASTVNLTSASSDGNGNFSTLAGGRANGTLLGLNASMAAATVSRVIGLVLPGAQLSGSLPAELARVEHLRHLDLSGNGLNGTLPAALLLNATELRVLSLAGNDLSGALPDASYARALQELNLSDNALAGWLPASLLRAPGLAVLGLANNYLAGELPAGGVGGLQVVDLSSNYFRGQLPADFGGTQLRFLNVSSNSLTGALPAELSDVVPVNTTVDLSNNNFTGAVPPAEPFAAQPASAYEGNPGLCGPPLKHACSIPSSLSNPPNATDSPPAFAAIPKSAARAPPGSPEAQAPRGGQGKLKPLVILAIVAGDLAGVGLLFMLFMYVYHIRKKRRQRREENPTAQQHKSIGGGAKALSVAGAKEDKAASSMACCIGGGKNDGSDSSDCSASSSDAASDDGGGEDPKKRAGSYIGWGTPQHHSKNKHERQQQQPPAPATLVTVDGGDGELEMETLLKASAYILGATGSSIVYKAVLADGTALAVRRIGESGGADKLKDFEAQVRAVARFRHPNILRLRGFYWGADEKLLIHDYAANGSLANIAFTRRFGASSPMHLNLEARLRIARGVARGLAFIHDKKGVHGNVKPSNILLGADMEPLVGDLGLDRLVSGESAAGRGGGGASARLFGSKRSMHSTSSLPDLSQMPGGAGAGPGASPSASAPPPYQAPECLKSLRPNAKWDVYSFGMVLLELLSGRVYSEVELCQWHAGAAGAVDDQRGRVLRMADPTLRGEAADAGSEDALLGCFRLAFACCAMAPGKRPAMRDAAALLDRIPVPSSASTSAVETPPY
ncbi:probable LRR receptor-like serine/threonine-protein kinase At4g37250 [Aegilops tauschii subsp. strangulata]|uniref:Protein kinase domain-containing protein n=2 Tax=Aegilops tauschii subsp. strangulata TaxID=200361 RepID=A0A453T7N5_AEGTS|nr:probable LRR receptor-like serine/threonine-protein kinase At4g37250 [Aegilops tauschii subsp. strangulata]